MYIYLFFINLFLEEGIRTLDYVFHQILVLCTDCTYDHCIYRFLTEESNCPAVCASIIRFFFNRAFLYTSVYFVLRLSVRHLFSCRFHISAWKIEQRYSLVEILISTFILEFSCTGYILPCISLEISLCKSVWE